MSIGTLTAVVDAETRGFVQGMANAAARMETFAREAKKLARDIAQVSMGMVLFAAAAVRMAASADAGVGRAVAALKAELTALAIQVAHLVLPALEQLTAALKFVADYFAGLSPETKKQISDWALFTIEVAAAALILGRVATVATAVATALQGIVAVIAAIGVGTLGAVLIVIIAIAAAVALLHKAWRENWGGIQEKTATVIKAISGYWASFKAWLSGNFFDWFIDKWASIEKSIAHAGNFLKNPLNSDERDHQNRVSDDTIDTWAKGAKGGAFTRELELAYEKASDVVHAGAEEWKLIFHEIAGAVKGVLPTSSGGHAGPGADKPTKGDRPSNGGVDANAAVEAYYRERYGNSSVEDLTRSGSRLGEDDEQGKTTAATALEYAKELEARKAFNESLTTLSEGLMNGAQLLLGRLGDLGQVMQSAIQGFQSGGIWGAIIAVFIELLSRFERFQELVDIGNGQIKELIDQLSGALNPLIDALRGFMGASGILTDVVMKLLTPIFKELGHLFEGIIPLIMAVASALEVLQPIFDLLGTVLGGIFKAVGYVLRFVGLTIMATMTGLLALWQGVLAIAHGISKAWTGGQGDAGLKRMMDENELKMKDMAAQMKLLAETGMVGVANAAAGASEDIGKMGDAAREATEQLLNVPQGYRVAIARFAATAVETSTAMFGTLAADYEQKQQRASFANSGNPFSRP